MSDFKPDYSPYNFVPLKEAPKRGEFPGHHRLADDGWSGTLVCVLKVLTPLFTADHRRAEQPRGEGTYLFFLQDSQGRPILQGTSLKGMVRSVYETLTNSCLPLAAEEGKSKKAGRDVRYALERIEEHHHARCNDLHKTLCPGCRLFGLIQEEEETHARGRLGFSDAVLTSGQLEKRTVRLKELSSPKPHHYPIYSATGRENGPIAGRKLYYHHDPGEALGIDKKDWNFRSTATREHAPPKTRFTFRLQLENLSHQELADLLFCLELDDGHAHKLGMAKPLGYGSCRIRVDRDRSRLWRGADRYRSWEAAQAPLGLEAARADLNDVNVQPHPMPRALSHLLAWPGKEHRKVGYLGFREYGGIGIDGDGRYSSVNRKGRGRGDGRSSPGGGFRMKEAADLAALQGKEARGTRPAPKEKPPPHRHRQGDKVKTKVLEATEQGFRVRIKETGEELEVQGELPLTVGESLKMRVLKVDSQGRILDLRP